MNNNQAFAILVSIGIAISVVILLIPASAKDDVFFIRQESAGNATETTECINIGSGSQLIKNSTGGDCFVRTIIGSGDISITNTSNTIVIDFNGTISGESTQCFNVGGQILIVKNSTSGNCNIKSLTAGKNLIITNTSDTIVISYGVKNIAIITANTTLDENHDVINCIAQFEPIYITIPNTSIGKEYTIKRDGENSFFDCIIINSANGAFDDNADNIVLSDGWDSVTIVGIATETWRATSSLAECQDIGTGGIDICIPSSDIPYIFLRGISAGTGISLSVVNGNIQITSTLSETTVCGNLGTGNKLHKTTTNCSAFSLIAGTGITISNTTDDYTFASQCANTGTGEAVCESANNINSLIAGSGITITDTVGDLTIAQTSTLLNSAVHTDTVTTSPLLGSMIFGTSTPAWSRLLIGTNGETLHVEGGSPTWEYDDVTTVSSSVTLTEEQDYIEMVMGASKTITLPSVSFANEGKTFIIKRLSGSGTLTIDASGAELIDSALQYNMTDDNQWVIITAQVGPNWGIVSQSPSPSTVSQVYSSLLKTNLPVTYTDIYVTAFDEENQNIIDCNAVNYFRFIYQWDFVGAGTDRLRWVNTADNTQVFYETPTFSVDQDATDSGWIAKPSFCISNAVTMEWQGLSSNGTNDPLAKGYKIMVR